MSLTQAEVRVGDIWRWDDGEEDEVLLAPDPSDPRRPTGAVVRVLVRVDDDRLPAGRRAWRALGISSGDICRSKLVTRVGGHMATDDLPTVVVSPLGSSRDRVLVRYEEERGDGETRAAYAYVRYGSAVHPVPGGALMIQWGETSPPVPISVRFERRLARSASEGA